MRRGDLELRHNGDDFVVELDGEVVLLLAPEELRWLCFMAGPAALVAHAPLETPVQAAARITGK